VKTHTAYLTFNTKKRHEIIDITDEVEKCRAAAGIDEGMVLEANHFGLLAASVIAGWLWQTQGAQWTFYAAATFSAFALVGLLSVRAKAATE